MAAFYAERARGGVGLIVTGGISPNDEGRPYPGGAKLDADDQLADHRIVTDAVHAAGGRICMQILHFGRYAYHPEMVAPSPIKAPIAPFVPRELSDAEVERTIDDYVRAAVLAQQAGYDGVEIMGPRATSSTSSSWRPPTSAPTGGAGSIATASSSRSRSCGAPGQRSARLDPHLPAEHARPGAGWIDAAGGHRARR